MKCDGCKWWSEMVAEAVGCGPILALCLNSDSPHSGKMVRSGCDCYEEGVSVDDPSLRSSLGL